MIFAALPDYGDNLVKVHLTCPWVEGIKAAIKAVHSAGVLHNDLHLRNFVGNAPDNVKLVDFAWSATSERSCQAMELEEKQFMETLPVQVSLASDSLAICLYKPSIVSFKSIYCCWTADVKNEMCVLQPPPILCHVCHLCARAIASLHHVSNLCWSYPQAQHYLLHNGLCYRHQAATRVLCSNKACMVASGAVGAQDLAACGQHYSICNITCKVSFSGNTSDVSLQIVQLPGSCHLTKHTLPPLYTTYWHLLCIVMLALMIICPAATHHMCWQS